MTATTETAADVAKCECCNGTRVSNFTGLLCLMCSPAPSKPEGVRRYRVSYANGVIEEDGSPRSPMDSKPMVLASAYDAKCAEVERLKRDSETYANFWHSSDRAAEQWRRQFADASDTITTLKSQLAEAQRDAGRLNFMATIMLRRPIWLDFKSLRAVDDKNNCVTELRAAIDAALALSSADGGEGKVK